MFNSTVSKYDPRTGRTTRLQNCVPYEQLLARDFSRCCYQPIRTIIVPTVSVVVSYSGTPRSFSWTPNGSGTLDTGPVAYGSGVIPFSSNGNIQLTSTITGPNPKIYSDNLISLVITNQSILSIELPKALNLASLRLESNNIPGVIDVSGAKLLEVLNVVGNSITDINGLNNCPNISEIFLDNNLFTQTSIDHIARDIYDSGAVSGFLNIGIQSEFIDPDSPALLQIKNQRQWGVIVP
jgi:hypothetical protein